MRRASIPIYIKARGWRHKRPQGDAVFSLIFFAHGNEGLFTAAQAKGR
jgi:hypothetical protein